MPPAMTGDVDAPGLAAASSPLGYRTVLHDGADAVLARVRAVEGGPALGGTAATVFQSASWLAAVARALAREGSAQALAVEVTPPVRGAGSSALAALIPLVVARERGIRVARLADIGVSDYRAPILGPAAPDAPGDVRALWRSVLAALDGRADLVRFEAMPDTIRGRANPLARIAGVARSSLTGLEVTCEGTVDQLLRDRGKKFRKEAERCGRLLAKEGTPTFRRATTPDAIGRAYAALEAQQSRRHAASGSGGYVLDRPLFSEFYRDLLLTERETGFAQIFTLEVGGEIVAVLLGLVDGDGFTLLRISNGGERWRHLSPGRLVVIAAMRYFVDRGIRRFDMGAGDYPFKRGFGAAEIPLHDLVAAVTVRGLPAVAAARAKAWVRRHPALAAAARRMSGGRQAAAPSTPPSRNPG